MEHSDATLTDYKYDMADVLSSLLGFLLIISVVVSVHEFGHFYMARLCGVQVEIFSIGFGRPLYRWCDKEGTEWCISLLPFGGYVKMLGDRDPASSPDLQAMANMGEADKNKALYYKPLWQKALVVAFGPIANYLLAAVIFTFLVFSYGKVRPTSEIMAIQKESAAHYIGLQPGDVIVEVNGQEVRDALEVKQVIITGKGIGNRIGNLVLGVLRSGQFKRYEVGEILKDLEDKQRTMKREHLGVVFVAETHEVGLLGAAMEAIKQCYEISVLMLQLIVDIVIGHRSIDNIGGPIKIAQYSGESVKKGAVATLWFVALVSINLGLVNLLPIPMLDGGHLLYYLAECVSGKPLPQNIQQCGLRVGLLLILISMVFITLNDIYKVFFP